MSDKKPWSSRSIYNQNTTNNGEWMNEWAIDLELLDISIIFILSKA